MCFILKTSHVHITSASLDYYSKRENIILVVLMWNCTGWWPADMLKRFNSFAVVDSVSSLCQLTECWVLQESHTAGFTLNSSPLITDKHANTQWCHWGFWLWWMDRWGDPVTESVIAQMKQPGADREISLYLWMIDSITEWQNQTWLLMLVVLSVGWKSKEIIDYLCIRMEHWSLAEGFTVVVRKGNYKQA